MKKLHIGSWPFPWDFHDFRRVASERVRRVHWVWIVLGLFMLVLVIALSYLMGKSDYRQVRGTPIAVLAYSYSQVPFFVPFYVTTKFKDRPSPQISITVDGAELGEVKFVLSDVKSCKATSATDPSRLNDLELRPSVLNAYFPVRTVPELEQMKLQRITPSIGDGYPIICDLINGSEMLSYDSHIVRFVKALNRPLGSQMHLSRSDTYQLDQPNIENVRFDDTYGSMGVKRYSPLHSALLASQNELPTPDALKQSLVTTAEWTDKHDSHMHEFTLLFLAAMVAGAFACFIEGIRPVFAAK